MLPGLNPKKMQGMMKKMGISQEEIDANRVIIEGEKNIIIENPQVTKIKMHGQESFQIVGDVREEEISEEDIKMVMDKANVGEEEAKKALEDQDGDIAAAVMDLKG
ncbi:MAG: nascent polypeptide-associated complex protein [Candidatus Nanoarchaeia archaeon]